MLGEVSPNFLGGVVPSGVYVSLNNQLTSHFGAARKISEKNGVPGKICDKSERKSMNGHSFGLGADTNRGKLGGGLD